MTGPESDLVLRDRLRCLAEHAPPPQGTATAERVVAGTRARRRRGLGWAAGVLAIGAVLTAVPSTVAGLSLAPAADTAGTTVSVGAAGSLYDVPTRGSLAGDADFLAGVRALPWGGPAGPPDGGLRPAEDSRRVLYAADVPGGSRWALVMGRVGRQLVHAWFTGPAGAAPGELTLTGAPAHSSDDQPITLLGAGAATGPLVVVGRPGAGAEYSPSLDRDASGRLRRSYVELPVVDGVPLGEVVAPVADGSGRVRVLRDGRDGTGEALVVPTLDDASSLRPAGPDAGQDGPQYWVRLRDCLAPLGFEVQLDPTGNGLSWSGGPALAPDVGPQSSAEQAENDAAFERCVLQVAGR